MLVLSRKTSESIHIGDDIVIKVIRISGSTVRVAVDAPPEVVIHRGEVREKIRQEEVAADSSPAMVDMISA